MRDVRYVVVHHPGPNWQPGVPVFEQPVLRQHVAHYRQLLAPVRPWVPGMKAPAPPAAG